MLIHSNEINKPNGEDVDKNPNVSGQSMSTTSGSVGSPSSRNPVSDSTLIRLNKLDIRGDDSGNTKKKRTQRTVGGDKAGRGLRQFSMKVCEKVENKGRTTYNEVADELVAEFSEPISTPGCPDQQQYDEKNIRRRVYDALNVLMAMDIISKDKKEIQWKGLPKTSLSDIEELKNECLHLRTRITKKATYLEELREQHVGLQNLVRRNEQQCSSGQDPSCGIALPFILVQTRPHATVEVEISEDMQLVHLDFNSTPFELHDDSYILKSMKLCENLITNGSETKGPSDDGCRSSSTTTSNQHQIDLHRGSGMPCSSSPIPGILKARIKHEP